MILDTRIPNEVAEQDKAAHYANITFQLLNDEQQLEILNTMSAMLDENLKHESGIEIPNNGDWS